MANLSLSFRRLLSFLLVALLSLVALARYESPDIAYSARGLALSKDGSAGHSIHPRALAWETARTKGHKLHCLMAVSKAEAQAANRGKSLEASEILQEWGIEENEGWSIADSHTPYFKNYLDQAFQGIGAPKNMHTEFWVHTKEYELWPDPYDPGEGIPEFGLVSGAVFSNTFIPGSGVIVADESRSVIAALKERSPGTWQDDLRGPLTSIRQWSDAAWMQWKKACTFASVSDTSNVKYIFQSWVQNEDTLSIVFQAMMNKYGRGATIGTWANRASFTLTNEPDELFAILGTPNGVGQPYLLITHKDQIGIKTINKVEVFVPNIAWPVTGTTVTDGALAAKIMLLFTVTRV